MNRELGIITFNRALNYGAILQAYAMKSICDNLGYHAHIVDYWHESGLKPAEKQKITPRTIKKKIRNSLGAHYHAQKERAFKSFRKKYLDESESCSNVNEVNSLGYDTYVIGSDQIWNYNITGGMFDSMYFGYFAKDAIKVVYAGSAHDTPFPLNYEKQFTQLLMKSGAAFSIREKRLAEYISGLTGLEYPVVVDPTLLAGRDIMDYLADSVPAEKEPYILIYQIDSNPASDISVKSLEKRFACKVYTMTVPRIGSLHGRRGTAGPQEFLSLIRGAQMVVTNSFHGIALSLLFEKQFFVYEHSGVMTRIDNLLDEIDLHDRKVRLVKDIDPGKTIDYASVRTRLQELRRNSMEYLKSALDGEVPVKKEEAFGPEILKMANRKKKDCSGCTACAAVCPRDAIEMILDEEGFKYPFIHSERCIHCGICDYVCGFNPKKAKDGDLSESLAFGIKHKDETARVTSRSGAAFIAFSDWILNRDGIIYGAVFDDNFKVRHIHADSSSQRDRMKNAKYVQSDLGNTFRDVLADLSNDKYVLFSGTPCQVSGLKAYISAEKTDCEKLFTCDLICHGTPSPAVWEKYLSYIKDKYGEEIVKANFRDKEFGWDSHCESFLLKSGRKIVSRDYTDLFYDHIMFRPSCHNCHFANTKRVSDLTLGDFWGIDKISTSFNDNKGVSLVLVNTEKGKRLLDETKANLELLECNLENCLQPTLVKPVTPSLRRDEFWANYQNMEFKTFLKKYTTPPTTVKRVKRSLKKMLYILHLRKHP